MAKTEVKTGLATRWYVRRSGVVKGPFPEHQIGRFVLLGRVREGDQLSPDGQTWHRLSELPALLPRAMRDGMDTRQIERLRRIEDERVQQDRRVPPAGPEGPPDDRRSGTERRESESPEVLRRRAMKGRLLDRLRHRTEHYAVRWASLGVLLAATVVVSLWLSWSSTPRSTPDCGAPAAAGVNWDNCVLDGLRLHGARLGGAHIRNAKLRNADLLGASLVGSDLAYAELPGAQLMNADLSHASLKGANLREADLAYADLRQADLSYADLTQANLGAARLEGARLDHALWMDGRPCAAGSIGRCLRP